VNFHRYEPILTGAKRVAKLFPQLPKLTRHDILSVLNDRTSGSMQRLHAHFDTCWEVDRQPYYRIYPSLISMLTRHLSPSRPAMPVGPVPPRPRTP
jgi:hypothetical protein